MEDLEITPDVARGQLAFFEPLDLEERFLSAGCCVLDLLRDFLDGMGVCDDCTFEFSMELTRSVFESAGLVSPDMEPSHIGDIREFFDAGLEFVHNS